VERGLTFFKTGEDALRLPRDPETRRPLPHNVRSFGFTDNLWGSKAREFVKTMKRLIDQHWEEIVEHTVTFMTFNTFDSDNENNVNNANDDTESLNLHAVIDLDWCIRHLIYSYKAYLDIVFKQRTCLHYAPSHVLHVLVWIISVPRAGCR